MSPNPDPSIDVIDGIDLTDSSVRSIIVKEYSSSEPTKSKLNPQEACIDTKRLGNGNPKSCNKSYNSEEKAGIMPPTEAGDNSEPDLTLARSESVMTSTDSLSPSHHSAPVTRSAIPAGLIYDDDEDIHSLPSRPRRSKPKSLNFGFKLFKKKKLRQTSDSGPSVIATDLDSSFCRHPPRKGIMSVQTLDESLRTCSKERDSGSGVDNGPNNKQQNLQLSHSSSLPDLRVTFNCIQLREYERRVGDNPSVSAGAPISIGWRHTEEITLDLDDYETARCDRRSGKQLQIPSRIRMDMLKETGHSREEIRKAVKGVNIARNRRRSTAATLEVAHVEETLQTVKRRFKRFVKRTDKKKEEEKLWINARERASAIMSKVESSNARRVWEENEEKEEDCRRTLKKTRSPSIVATEED